MCGVIWWEVKKVGVRQVRDEHGGKCPLLPKENFSCRTRPLLLLL